MINYYEFVPVGQFGILKKKIKNPVVHFSYKKKCQNYDRFDSNDWFLGTRVCKYDPGYTNL